MRVRGGEQRSVGRLVQQALFGYRDHAQVGAARCAGQLPGHDVGVVLHLRDEDLVPGLQQMAVSGGHQIDGFGGAAGEDDLPGGRGMEKSAHFFPGSFHGIGGLLGKGVDAAVDVGVLVAVIAVHGADHLFGFLGGSSVVQIGEGISSESAGQQRETFADVVLYGFHVDGSLAGLPTSRGDKRYKVTKNRRGFFRGGASARRGFFPPLP